MSFENASVTKGLMLGIALSSITVGIFDLKHYMHLQLVPHISKYHQYWRLFSHHLVCANSGDLLLAELLLYNVAVRIERTFGSAKFASFLVISMLVSTISTFLSLLLFSSLRLGILFNVVPSAPISLIFSIIYQYMRLVPQAYQMKLFGLDLSDKIWIYVLAGQLAVSQFPSTLLPTLVGLHTGYLYRSDILQLKSWRIPQSVQNFVQAWIKPLLGEEGPIRRTHRVLPEGRQRRRADDATTREEEVVTTARRPRANAEDGTRGRRQSDVRTLSGMFPNVARGTIMDVLQRSPNVEAAAAILLSSQT